MGLGASIAVGGKPDDELGAAESVEVYEQMSEPTRYRLRYALDIAEGDLPLLKDSRFEPGSELSVLLPNDTTPHCLVRGPVHGQRVSMVHGGETSTLDVLGADRLIELDREAMSAVWQDATDSEVAMSVLSGYGLVPDSEETRARHVEAKHTLVQRETDLRFLQRLARRNGFLLWMTADAPGVDTAHFKRPPLADKQDSDLVINLSPANLDRLDIDWDVERPTKVEARQLDLNTVEPLEGGVEASPQTALGTSALGAIGAGPRTLQLSAPVDAAGDLMSRGEGALIESDWFLRVRCETTVESLGTAMRAHTVVGLRGAGSRHDGLYFVSSVRHQIDASRHLMEIELIRNAWGN